MDIDIADIIATLLELVYKFWAVLIIPALGLMLCNRLKSSEARRVALMTILMASAVAFSVALVERFDLNNLILIGICVFEFCELFVKTMIHGKNETGIRQKWRAYNEYEKKSRTVSKLAASGVGWLAVVISLLFVLSGDIMEHFAKQELERDWYFVSQDYEGEIVVFQNDDQYVLMTREGDALQPEYRIVPFWNIGNLTYEHTGVLELAVPGGS